MTAKRVSDASSAFHALGGDTNAGWRCGRGAAESAVPAADRPIEMLLYQ